MTGGDRANGATPAGDTAALRAEIADCYRRTTAELAALEGRLSALQDLAGPDVAVLEAVVAVRMASSVLAPLRSAMGAAGPDEAGGFAAMMGGAIRQALATGSAHVETQSGLCWPCVPGVAPAAQGLVAAGADQWEPATGGAGGGTALFWLADRGDSPALAVAGAELVALLKAAHGDLAARSERSILKAALEAGAVMVDRRHPAQWSQMVKVARRARRLVVIPLPVVFGADGPSDAGAYQPAAAGSVVDDVSPDTAAPRVPLWLMDRVDHLGGRARAELLGRLSDAGVLDRRLTHVELVAVERWVAEAEAAPTAGLGSADPARAALASRPAPAPGAVPGARPARAPAGVGSGSGAARYRYVATDGRRVITSAGEVAEGPWAHAGELVVSARQLVPAGEMIIVVHPSAHFLLGLPERPDLLGERGDDGLRHRFARDAANATTAVREVGGAGGLIVEAAGAARVQLLFPGFSGEFARAVDADELVEAVEAFCGALDFGYSYSATSTLHRLVEFTQGRARRLGPPAVHPDLDPPFAPAGYSVPAAAWSRPMSAEEAARPYVVVCDRSGSYLSAWGSCVLADGPWTPRPGPLGPSPACQR